MSYLQCWSAARVLQGKSNDSVQCMSWQGFARSPRWIWFSVSSTAFFFFLSSSIRNSPQLRIQVRHKKLVYCHNVHKYITRLTHIPVLFLFQILIYLYVFLCHRCGMCNGQGMLPCIACASRGLVTCQTCNGCGSLLAQSTAHVRW